MVGKNSRTGRLPAEFFETLDDLCLFLEEAHCSIAIVTAESLANADGVSALRKIAPALGVICMTEGCEASERLPLLESGADYCVDRHGNPRELVSVVANLLRRLRRFINLPSGFAEEGASCLATDQRRMVLEQSGMPRNRADHQGEANLDVPV